MKKLTLFAAVLFVLAGCVVTSESFRYKNRFDRFYNLLTDREKQLFAEDKLAELGALLDTHETNDANFYKEYRDVQIYEAITTFDGKKTAWFFRYIILKELNRDNLFVYLNFLSANEQTAFTVNSGINEIVEEKYLKDAAFKAFIDNMRKEFRLYGFSNIQVNEFFRNVVFPEVSRDQIFPLLTLLKSKNLLLDYQAADKNIPAIAQKLDEAIKGSPAGLDKSALEDIKKSCGLTKLDTSAILSLYNDIIMKEMDQDAVNKIWMKLL
ncbi:MAG: hypothetical protein A2Y33_08405 [Spirochaetes bacterium GWF1_51_8]|nr:MAG: hypothetical protein A2Y33_08405 [Spirochaetes bacterium GWF1_51_8]